MRTSPPRLLTRNRSSRLPGTRSMSPKEVKITSGRAAMARARSMVSSGVTQTGQPGPWTRVISSGSSWSMPWRMMAWVWPPQISMMVQGRVTVRGDAVQQGAGQGGVAEFVEVLHVAPMVTNRKPVFGGGPLPV